MNTDIQENINFGYSYSSDHIRTMIESAMTEMKFADLRADIGDVAFDKLSEKDKHFIVETEGMLDLGYEATEKDLHKIANFIKAD
jgi:hypothetical protein